MSEQRAGSLSDAVRKHWRNFLFAWVLPLVLLFGSRIAEKAGHLNLFFIFVAMPLFFWSSHIASRPYQKRQITYFHAVVLGLIIPFLVWTLAVMCTLPVAST
ncbi:hypothetical protein [Rhodoferax sp. GW822-FHT02A01]|uniref:hypothetical protein n=1 Tax=Rhodoferax sp. GW822-FHT02A01 TaxID=3141537 RepID=UPI00315DAB6D